MNRTPPKAQIQYDFASDGDGLATKLRDCQGYIIMPKAILTTLGPYAARLVGSLLDERRRAGPTNTAKSRESQRTPACLFGRPAISCGVLSLAAGFSTEVASLWELAADAAEQSPIELPPRPGRIAGHGFRGHAGLRAIRTCHPPRSRSTA